MEPKIAVRLEGHRANELHNGERAGVQRGAQASSTESARPTRWEEGWPHAGSTRNEVAEEAQASAADLPLDDERSHSPLLLPNQRQHEVCQILASSIRSSEMTPAPL